MAGVPAAHVATQAAPAAEVGSALLVASAGAPPAPTARGVAPIEPVVAMTATPSGTGAWLAATDGGLFALGDAPFHGSMGGIPLNQPVVGMGPTTSGAGYWLVAADGGMFAFGDAPFLGSMGAVPLNRPIVGFTPTPSGQGYLLVAADGGVFAFGDAAFSGSLGDRPPPEPVVALAATPSALGYWLVTASGEVFAFGDAVHHGSSMADRRDDPVAAIVATPSGGGYWFVTGDGDVIAHGDAAPIEPTPVDGDVVAADRVGEGLWLAADGTGPSLSVFQPRGLSPTTSAQVAATLAGSGARSTVAGQATFGLTTVWRGGRAVAAAGGDGRWPFTVVAVDPATTGPVIGATAQRALRRGEIALGHRAAALRGVQVGDELDVIGYAGRRARLRVGVIVPDDRLSGDRFGGDLIDGGASAAVRIDVAASLGLDEGRVVIAWGVDDLEALGDRLDGALSDRWVRVTTPADGPNPGAILPDVELERRLGQLSFRPAGSSAVALDPRWVAAAIRTERVPILGRVTCHAEMLDDLRGALTEIVDRGLAGLIRADEYGGCWTPRLVRGAAGGALSRHAWGLAVDLNTRTNGFGATPTMDLRVVEVFRSWGFAWGGSWTRPDGMHFEWIGGR